MSDNVASPGSTGGPGYSFEHCEAAWWALCMLLGRPVFDTELGAPIAIRVQSRVDDWRLDDIVAEFHPVDDRPRFAAVSAKKEKFVNSNGFDDSFVEECWQQLAQPGKSNFRPDRDRLVLCCGDLARTVSDAASDLIALASSDPASFATRITVPKWTNSLVRKLADSFACPSGVSATSAQRAAPAALIQSVRVLERDWLKPSSRWQTEAIQRARDAVSSGKEADAKHLWTILRSLARDLSGTSGVIDLRAITDAARGQVELRDIPDYTVVWRDIRNTTVTWRSETRSSVGDRCSLPREELSNLIQKQLSEHVVAGVVGSSGSGKSAVVRAALEERLNDPTAFVLAGRCDDLAQLAADHGSMLSEALSLVTAKNPILVLDSAEYLEETRDISSVSRLVAALRIGITGCPWRVVVVARAGSLEGALGRLAQSVGDFPGNYGSAEVGDLSEDELKFVVKDFPGLAHLLRDEAQRRILARPQVLDMLVRAGSGPLPAAFPTSTAFRDWYWDRFVSAGPQGDARAAVARQIATHLAEQNLHRIPVERLSVPEVQQLGELQRLGLLRRSQETVSFAHDTYTALAKERALLGRVGAEGAKGLPASLSGWLDAVALLSVRLLESGQIGSLSWDQLYKTLARGNHAEQAPDAATDALFTAADVPGVLGAALPTLLDDDGKAVKRMLRRIAFSWSVLRPDLHKAVSELDQGSRWRIESRIEARIPMSQGWFALMEWISQKPAPVLAEARPEVFDLCRLWINLSFALNDKNLPYAKAAADLVLGEAEAECRREYARRPAGDRVVTTALLCHHWFPMRTLRIIRTLAGLEPFPLPAELTRTEMFPAAQSMSLAFRMEVPEPWSVGPLRRPSGSLREVVLSATGAEYLAQIDPQFASEVFLCVLITSPSERRDEMGGGSWSGLVRHICFPPNFWFPPVRALLSRNVEVAVMFVATLVDFATTRWLEHTAQAEAPPATHITLADGTLRKFQGGADVFAWSRGGTNGEDSAKGALMTLEQWLYELLQKDDQRETAAQAIDLLLRTSSSAAVLGLLSDVALRFLGLLVTELEPLVTGREIYRWTLQRVAPGGLNTAMIGWIGEPLDQQERIWEFHNLQHRRYDFQKIVLTIFANRDFDWPALTKARQRWQADADTDEDLFFERLAAACDGANWRERDVDGQTYWELELPGDLEAKSRAEARAANAALEDMVQPFRWGSMLSGRDQVDEDAVFAELRRLDDAEKNPQGLPRNERASVIAGVAAVAVIHCEERLISEGLSRLCRDWLLRICTAPPPPEPLERRESVGLAPWDEFCARGIATLWLENPQDPRLRRAIANLIVGPHDRTTAAVLDTLAPRRQELGGQFDLLLDLLALISRAMLAIHWSGASEVAMHWVLAIQDAADEFVAGRSYVGGTDWLALAEEDDPLARFGRWLRRAGHRLRRMVGKSVDKDRVSQTLRWVNIDLPDREAPARPMRRGLWNRTLVAGLSWLPAAARGMVENEDQQLSRITLTLARLVAASARAAAEEHQSGRQQVLHPDDGDRSLTDMVAAYASRAVTADVENLLTVAFRVPRDCSPWLADLVRSIYSEWLRDQTSYDVRAVMLESLLRHVEEWDRRRESRSHWDTDRAKLLSCVLGTDVYTPVSNVWPAEASDAVTNLVPWIERWWAIAANEPQCVAAFCAFLCAPACERVRSSCLRWIEPQHIQRLRSWDWERGVLVSLLEMTAPQTPGGDPHWQSLLEAASSGEDAGALALAGRAKRTNSE